MASSMIPIAWVRSKIFRSPMLFVITRPHTRLSCLLSSEFEQALKVDPSGFEPLTFWLQAKLG